MTLASIERRLAKIETARRPPRGLFYVAWGHDPAEIEGELLRAREADLIAAGDPVVRCAWPVEYSMPASRWALDETRAFDSTEFGALMGEVDRLQDGLIEALHAEARARGEPELPPPSVNSGLAERDAATGEKTDAALFASILAVPLGRGDASLTGDRAQRLVRHMVEVGLRDRIRGRDEALLHATERAGRVVRH